MKVYQIHPLAAAIIFTALCMGFIGLFVVLPIAAIEWTWNFFVPAVSKLPEISMWQAGLLYAAITTILFLLGIVQIEFEANKLD